MMVDIHTISFFLFNLFLIPVSFFSFIYYMLALRSVFEKEEKVKETVKEEINEGDLPYVSVQIPTFNELVAIRCAEDCLKFDYPENKFEVIIGDDSDDPVVSKAIDNFAQKHKGRVKVTKRGDNKGFKPGNLNHMLKFSQGEIIVIFDSDFVAPRNFLRKMVRPFMEDDAVAGVQAEWDFLNEETNYVSKLSSTLLVFYYSIIVPVNKRVSVPFLFGSGEAVRKDVLLKLGGWKDGSLTEDTEFSIRLFKEGYKIIYLDDVKVWGEVPYTLKGLMNQQKRWAYGNTNAFMDHAKSILSGRLSTLQKIMISYTTSLGYLSNFFLLSFLVFGFIYFFSQPPAPIDLEKFFRETSKIFLVTSGFISGGMVALFKKNKVSILPHSLLSVVLVGVLVSYSICIGFLKALLGKEILWSPIKKEGNIMFREGVGDA